MELTLKDSILVCLLSHRGEDVSGQALADMSGVSRSAVWKAVTALKAEGWDIASGTKRGYRLPADCDRLSAAYLQQRLSEEALPVYVYESVDSTNNEAKRRIARGERRFLILSDGQTGGRGRRGKSFFSPAGSGLYLSLAMSPDAAMAEAAAITSYAAVCTAQAIESVCGVSCGIKWVNDLYRDGKKLAGILTEAVTDLESGTVASVIVGIGINLLPSAVPEELRDIVGFLGVPGVRNDLAAEIARRLLRFVPGDRSYLDEYRRLSLVLGRAVRYERQDQTVSGTAVGIDDNGGLVVDLGTKKETLRSGEISLAAIEGLKD